MQLGKAGHELAQASTTYKQARFFGVLALWILGWFAISVQVFTRKGFGERHASIINLFFGLMAVSLFSGFGNALISSASSEEFSRWMFFLYWAAILLCAWHRFVIWNKNRKNVIWHSMYSGTPLFAFTGLSEGLLKRWVEPIFLASIAYFARHHHEPALAIWLYIGAFAVFVHETLTEYMLRSEALDRRDAWIESTGRSRTKLDEKRRGIISRAIASHGLSDCLAAVRGWVNDPWNERHLHNGVDVLLRDAAHIEKFRDLWLNGKPLTGRQAAQVTELDSWLRSEARAVSRVELIGGPA